MSPRPPTFRDQITFLLDQKAEEEQRRAARAISVVLARVSRKMTAEAAQKEPRR